MFARRCKPIPGAYTERVVIERLQPCHVVCAFVGTLVANGWNDGVELTGIWKNENIEFECSWY